MASNELIITLPADDKLADQVEQRLARHAAVMRPPPQALNLETINLILSIAASTASLAVAYASIQQMRAETLKTLLEVKDLLTEQGLAGKARIATPSGDVRSFAEVDEAFLKQLLEIDA